MITDVTTTAATGTDAAGQAMKKSTGMNKDDFLKLFVTQLQHQDPLNPQDSTQFIGQLAQLTQVEQAYNTNTNLQNLLSQAGNSTTIASLSVIGKQIEANGAQMNLTAGGSASANFVLDQAASQVSVTITSANGTVVKTLTQANAAAGRNAVNWDGTDQSGAKVSDGAYSFNVSAKDGQGNIVTATPFIVGKVDGVDMSGATPVLSIGKVSLSLADVTSVKGG